MNTKKTNAARLLDSLKISYELVSYDVDENDLSAVNLASKVGVSAAQVFKTLVLRGSNSGVFIAVLPGDEELDLKKAAKTSGNKSAAMTAVKELLNLTGYVRGGCSPLAMKRDYPVFIHQSCMNYPFIYVSAGKRGTQIKISPAGLIAGAKAVIADLTEE
jgi:Cys-tRNA(Pro)/Cys-tRNA(Cys) deacylase